MKERRIIIHKPTGQEFTSIKEASKITGDNESRISKQVGGWYEQTEWTCRFEEVK